MPKGFYEKTSYHLDLGPPPPELLEWAKENINETEEEKCIKLHELREMIYEKGDIVAPRTDDAFLLRFLRARRFNLERAYKLLCKYCNFKENNPEFHVNVKVSELRQLGEDDVIQVLPFREQTGRRIMIYKFGNWNTNEYSIRELFQLTLIFTELGILEQRAQILGGIVIFDLQGMTMAQAWQVTPAAASKVIELMGVSSPLTATAIHVIFESWVCDVVYNIFKPLLSEHMKKRLFFHGHNLESLHKHIDPNCLPKRYGGTRREANYNKWLESFKKTPTILKELNRLGYIIEKEELEIVYSKSEDDTEEEKENGKEIQE